MPSPKPLQAQPIAYSRISAVNRTRAYRRYRCLHLPRRLLLLAEKFFFRSSSSSFTRLPRPLPAQSEIELRQVAVYRCENSTRDPTKPSKAGSRPQLAQAPSAKPARLLGKLGLFINRSSMMSCISRSVFCRARERCESAILSSCHPICNTALALFAPWCSCTRSIFADSSTLGGWPWRAQ